MIHNAGVGYREGRPVETEQGIPQVFAVNTLAPYILTALIERPDRLIYRAPGMHHDAAPNFDDLLLNDAGKARRPTPKASHTT